MIAIIQIFLFCLLAFLITLIISVLGKEFRAYDKKQRAKQERPLIDKETGFYNLGNFLD